MQDIVIDARALQDPNYRTRGIGRLTIGLLRHAKAELAEGTRRIALVDPALPPLASGDRALFDRLHNNAYGAALKRPACFLEPSPLTHDSAFVARLLADPAIFSAAVVHDLIPLAEPDKYLPSRSARITYYAALAWLPRYRRFFANSAATAEELRLRLAFPADRITVMGAPLDPVFIGPVFIGPAGGPVFIGDGPAAGPPAGPKWRHVVVAGGSDPRKNTETALHALAASAALTTRGITVIVPDGVTDEGLARLYREALAVVCPSRAEGFSYPVIEAMAAGAPVIASDIPAHRELIENRELLFDPDDAEAIRCLIERLADDAPFRQSVLREQAPVWPRFRAERIARMFWAEIQSRSTQAAPAIIGRARPAIAMLTPLPPDRSGCADYSAAISRELGRLVELHLFTATPHPRPIAEAASIQPLSALPSASARFARVVGVMGNSEFHLGIFRLLLRYGGACIAHDARLLGFYRGLLGLARTKQVAAAELGRDVSAAEIDTWLEDESRLPILFLSELADAADPIIFHSSVTAQLIGEKYGIAAKSLPFALYRNLPQALLVPAARAAARRRLEVPTEELLIGTFGYVNRSKCPEACIQALALLRERQVPARLVFVGRCDDDLVAPLATLAAELGVAQQVRLFLDYVSEATYRDFLSAADVGLQLRAHGFGSLSGALSDCIGAGLPSVAHHGLAEALAAPATVRPVDDAASPAAIARAIAEVAESYAHHDRLSCERTRYVDAHSPHRYAAQLCEMLGLEVRTQRAKISAEA